jgi:hypothetical protein
LRFLLEAIGIVKGTIAEAVDFGVYGFYVFLFFVHRALSFLRCILSLSLELTGFGVMEGGRRGTGVGYMYLLEGSGDDRFLLSTYLPLLFSFLVSLGCYAGSGILEIPSLRRLLREINKHGAPFTQHCCSFFILASFVHQCSLADLARRLWAIVCACLASFMSPTIAAGAGSPRRVLSHDRRCRPPSI